MAVRFYTLYLKPICTEKEACFRGDRIILLFDGFCFMSFHMKSLAKRNLFLHVPSLTRVVSHAGYISLFSTLSSVSLEESSSVTSNKTAHQGKQIVEFGRESDLNILIGKIFPGSSEDEVFQSLLRDPACSTVQITDSLVDKLLDRFKDDWKSALGVFRWAKSYPDYEPLPELYDKMVDILGKMKQMQKMMEMLHDMRLKFLVSFNTVGKVMRRLCGAGEWKAAVKIFDELGNFGLVKSTESMNLLLDTLCKEKQVEHAREVFLELKSCIPPNANTFNIFIHGWCKTNRVDEAYWTIQEMKGYGCRPCVISYSTIIQSYCQLFNFHKVYEVLDEMQAERCPPNVVTFTTIMCSLTKSQEYEEALGIAERMKSVGCKPDTLFYNALIHTLGRAGRPREAIRVFKFEMPGNGAIPNTSTYNSMIAMFCHHDQGQKALEFLHDLENSPYCKPDVQSYYPLLKLCFKAGEVDTWLSQMLDDMVDKHHLSLNLSSYTLLIHGLCKASKCEWAYLLFKEMIGKEITPRYRTCQLLLDAIKQRNMNDAAELIEGYMKKMKSS